MYAKLFSSILDSSLWTQPLPVRVVWITMLAMADREGYVYASLSGLARRALVSETDCKGALDLFMGADAESGDRFRNPQNEGRRVEESDGGWLILNYPYYRGLQDADERREQNKLAKRRQREKERGSQQSQDSMLTKDDKSDEADVSAPSSSSGDVTSHTQTQLTLNSTQLKDTDSAADAAVGVSGNGKRPRAKPRPPFEAPSMEEVKEFAEKRNLSIDAEDFYLNYRKNGWKVSGRPMVDWKAAMLQWQKRKERGEFA